MDMNFFQRQCLDTAVYPAVGNNLTYPVLSLCGEAGELANKVKKILRDGLEYKPDEARPENREKVAAFNLDLAKELGDALWYVALVAHELGWSLENVATLVLAKVSIRRERGMLQGSGDNR